MNEKYKQALDKVKELEIQANEAHRKYTISERGSVEYGIWKPKWEELRDQLEVAKKELIKLREG